MSKIEEKLERIAMWFDQTQKYGTPRTCWTLHQSSSKHSKGKTLLSNYNNKDMEDSKGLLLESIQLYAPDADKFIHIYLRSSRTDSEPVYNVIENPYYNSGIGSVSSSNSNNRPMMSGYSREDVEKIVEERVKSEREKLQLEKEMAIQKIEMDRKLEDMQAAIEGMKENNQSLFERVLGIAEHPVIASVLEQLAGKALGGPIQMSNQTVQETGEQVEHHQDSAGQVTSEEVSYAMLDVFESQFGEEQAKQMISELGLLAKMKPELLTNLRPTVQSYIKKANNEEGTA